MRPIRHSLGRCRSRTRGCGWRRSSRQPSSMSGRPATCDVPDAPPTYPSPSGGSFRSRRRGPRAASVSHGHAGSGSGFIIDAEGYIVTNHHVVDGSKSIEVQLSDGRTFQPKVVGSDAETDLALLKIEATGLPMIPLGSSSALKVAEPVMAIGNPFGFDHTVTVGIVSGTGRFIGQGRFDDFIQTDAAINPATPAARSSTPRARPSASTRRSAAARVASRASGSRSRSTWRSRSSDSSVPRARSPAAGSGCRSSP